MASLNRPLDANATAHLPGPLVNRAHCTPGMRPWSGEAVAFAALSPCVFAFPSLRFSTQKAEAYQLPNSATNFLQDDLQYRLFDLLADAPRSCVRDKVEAVKIHHLGPRRHKIAYKRLLRVVACIDFRDGSELRV